MDPIFASEYNSEGISRPLNKESRETKAAGVYKKEDWRRGASEVYRGSPSSI